LLFSLSMGTWGTAISSNDTFADIYAGFSDLYNEGEGVAEITNKLVASNQCTIKDPEDSNNFWFALARAQWECKQLDQNVYQRIKDIIETGADVEAWRRLGSDDKTLQKRKIVLDKFLAELSTERPKAKTRKKKVIRQPAFEKGDCITFKLKNGNYGGAVILEAIYNSPYPYNLVATTTINQSSKPTKRDFMNSDVLMLNFGKHQNKRSIHWFLPIRYKQVTHLFEKIDNIDVEITYDKQGLGYGSCADLDIYVIEEANKQYEHELVGNKRSDESISIKKLTSNSKWKLW
jgi:hypothetical protein